MNKEFIFIPAIERGFPYYRVKKLFNRYNKYFPDLTFRTLMKYKKPHIYAVIVDNDFQGVLFIDELLENKCYIGGFANRKQHNDVIQAIKYFCEHLFKVLDIEQVRVRTEYLQTVIACKKAGFIKDNNELILNRSI